MQQERSREKSFQLKRGALSPLASFELGTFEGPAGPAREPKRVGWEIKLSKNLWEVQKKLLVSWGEQIVCGEKVRVGTFTRIKSSYSRVVRNFRGEKAEKHTLF